MSKAALRALSAHIGYLFTELPLERRPAAAKRAGFDAIEHPLPAALPAETMARILDAEGLVFAQLAAGFGNVQRGEKGLAALPGREADFRAALDAALDYAEAIACRLVHPMAGVVPVDVNPGAATNTYLENLAYGVERCRGRRVSIMIEAISPVAVPGYFMSDLAQAVAVTDTVSGISILFDTFHARANGVDAADFVATYAARIGHVHVADHPGRHEPGTGGIAFEPFLDALIAANYRGAVGFEYLPRSETRAGLGWLDGWKSRLQQGEAALSI